MDSEVLVYISKLRKYFETNREAREYFIGELNEETFMGRVSEVAEKNFYDNGDPALSTAQFEFIKKVLNSNVFEINVDIANGGPMIFIDTRGLATIKNKK